LKRNILKRLPLVDLLPFFSKREKCKIDTGNKRSVLDIKCPNLNIFNRNVTDKYLVGVKFPMRGLLKESLYCGAILKYVKGGFFDGTGVWQGLLG